MNTKYHCLSIRQTLNERDHKWGGVVSAHMHPHTKYCNLLTTTKILSNSSLTPAVGGPLPRARSHNQTNVGDQSTKKAKLTKRSHFPLCPTPPLLLLETKDALPSAGHLENYIFVIKLPQNGLSSLHLSSFFFFKL